VRSLHYPVKFALGDSDQEATACGVSEEGGHGTLSPHRDRADSFRRRTGFLRPGPSGIPLRSFHLLSWGSSEPLIVLDDVYTGSDIYNCPGFCPWLLGIDPKCFRSTTGCLGIAFGPLPISPLQINRVWPAILFGRNRHGASRDALWRPAYQAWCRKCSLELGFDWRRCSRLNGGNACKPGSIIRTVVFKLEQSAGVETAKSGSKFFDASMKEGFTGF